MLDTSAPASGVWDGGVMGWRGTDFSENEAKQRAADMNVMFDQYGDLSLIHI